MHALRLVCHAARDDLVDGCCRHLRPLEGCTRAIPPRALAQRLRCLERLTLPERWAQQECADLAEFLLRLPGRGARLGELRLGCVSCGYPFPTADDLRSLPLLTAAVARLRGLRRLQFSVAAFGANNAARLVLEALAAALRATPACLSYSQANESGAMRAIPLWRLESLEIPVDAATRLPRLTRAAALTALRSLELCDERGDEQERAEADLEDDEDEAFVPELLPPPAPAVGRAPWLAGLTRLRVCGRPPFLRWVAASLAPRSLAAVRELTLLETDSGNLAEDVLAPLVAAANPATLRTLHVPGRSYALAARLAEALPALRSLHFIGCPDDALRSPDDGGGEGEQAAHDTRNIIAAEYATFHNAHLAPLTSLSLEAGGWLCAEPARLAMLLSAPWAASLRKLRLKFGCSSGDDGGRLPSLAAALPQLRHLHTLRICWLDLDPSKLCRALAAGADAWALRLVELQVHVWPAPFSEDGDVLRALLRAPLSRLERLAVRVPGPLGDSDLRARLMDECVRALPTLRRVELTFSSQMKFVDDADEPPPAAEGDAVE